MEWRRIGSDHYQPRLRTLFQHFRQRAIYKPGECVLIWCVPEAAQKKHGEWLAPLGLKIVAAGVDSGAKIVVHAIGQLGHESSQILTVRRTAHLDAIELR